jgi:L-lactate dehydrogenase complex protein LldG
VNIGLRIYTWAASKSSRFTLALKLVGFFSRIVAPRSDWLRLPSFTGWGYSKDLPRPARQPFRARWADGLDQKSSQSGVQNINIDPFIMTESKSSSDLQEGEDLIQRFADELAALDGYFTLCTAEDLPKLVFDELQNHGISSILSWEKNLLPHGLIDSLRSKGITVSEEFNEEVKAGLSGTQAAIAETGTLVLPSGKGRAQFVSLTPEIHFAVLRASDIFQNINQVLDLPEVRQASTTALISGPSRTADIEMTLTLGVHGPRKVHVFCLERE